MACALRTFKIIEPKFSKTTLNMLNADRFSAGSRRDRTPRGRRPQPTTRCLCVIWSALYPITSVMVGLHAAEGDITGQNTAMVLRHPPKNALLARLWRMRRAFFGLLLFLYCEYM
jgi:hypothetical protein